jgi:hypothetical protein
MIYLLASLLLIGDLFSLRWFFLGLERVYYSDYFLSTLIYVGLVLVLFNKKWFYLDSTNRGCGYLLFRGLHFWILKQFKIKIQLLSLERTIMYLKSHFYSYVNLLLPSAGVLIVFFDGLFGFPNNVAFMRLGIKFTSAFQLSIQCWQLCFTMVNSEQKTESLLALPWVWGYILSVVMFVGSDYLIVHWLKFENKIDLDNTLAVILIFKSRSFFWCHF